MAHEAYFASSTEPNHLPAARESLRDFVQRHAERRIALVTSGGTTVPLEKNTVRFIDNFSTGNRGAASVEQLLKADYAVVFVYRTHSAFPFARQFTPPALSAEQLLQRAGTEAHAALVTAAAAEYAQHAPRLLVLPFTSVDEYLHLLRAACVALAAAGPRALLYLAAAVSDFFIPERELSTHKIQSGGGGGEGGGGGGGGSGGGGGGTGDGGGGGDGGLELHLRPVPKLLAAIKRGGDSGGGSGAPAWAPQALLVSFKLETNEAILKAKAAGAIARYGVDVVCANQLQTYKHEVTLMTQQGDALPTVAAKVCGDETEEVAVSGVLCRRISTQTSAPATRDAAGGAAAAEVAVEIEVPLLAAVVELHSEAIASGAAAEH